MNRREAQQHLAAVAQAIREGKFLRSDDYPVLSIETRSGISLWEFSAARAVPEHWSDKTTAKLVGQDYCQLV